MPSSCFNALVRHVRLRSQSKDNHLSVALRVQVPVRCCPLLMKQYSEIEVNDEWLASVRYSIKCSGIPTMELLHQWEPHIDTVMLAAQHVGLLRPVSDLRDVADEAAARHIAHHVLPLTPGAWRGALDVMLEGAMRSAAQACQRAGQAAMQYRRVRRRATPVRNEDCLWRESWALTLDALLHEVGALVIVAHERCEEAHGVARAVGLARRGKAWAAYNPSEVTAWLTKESRPARET